MAIRNSCASKSSAKGKGTDCLDIDVIDAALLEISKNVRPDKPKGFTAKEYADKKEIPLKTAQKHLRSLYCYGYVERKVWTPLNGGIEYVYQMKDK